MERIDKLVSLSFGISRAQAKEALKKGRVTSGGITVKKAETKVDESAELTLDGRKAAYEKYVYIMMDKPAGCLSATEDTRDPVALELLPEEIRHRPLGVAGRLDKDTTGFLIVTDDGDFNHALTSPSKNIDKTYEALVDLPVGQKEIDEFAQGMVFSDFEAKPAVLRVDEENPCRCFVTIKEGKYHQVKRMFAKTGRKVLTLRRLSIGGIDLDMTLGEGGWRRLSGKELQILFEKCGIKQ